MKIKHKLSKKLTFALIIYTVSAILFLVFIIRYNHLSGLLPSQMAAGRWQGVNEQSFVQVSCFFSSDNRAAKDDIDNFRQKLDKKLAEALLDKSGRSQSWIDAYSAQGEINVTSTQSTINTNAFGVGGEYFFFHPLQLRNGRYISGDDLSRDRIILDEQIAWQLYGSVNLAGMEVEIDDKAYIIAGVIRCESDRFSNFAEQNTGRVYMSYDAFSKIKDVGINCYEIVMPEPVPGFAFSAVSYGFHQPQKEVLNNSERFSLKSILQLMTNTGVMVMHSKGIAYPYWENAARLIQYRQVLLLFFIILLAAFISVSFIVFLKLHSKRIKDNSKSLIKGIINREMSLIIQHKGKVYKDGRHYIKKLKENLRKRCSSGK